MSAPQFKDLPDQDWHGWGVGDVSLHIGPVPTRKRIALHACDGPVSWVMAYFRNEHEAQRAMAIIDAIVWPGVPR